MQRSCNELAIGPKYKRLFERAEARYANEAFCKLIEPILYQPERDLHVPFFNRKKGTFSQFPLEHMIVVAEGDEPDAILPLAQLFANPLRFAEYDRQNANPGVRSGATAPKLRVTNGGIQILGAPTSSSCGYPSSQMPTILCGRSETKGRTGIQKPPRDLTA